MKIIASLLFLIGTVHSVSAQTEEYIDQTKVRNAIEKGKGMTAEELTDHEWVVNLSIMQLIYDDPEENDIMDLGFDGYTYTFHPDGTFDVDAIIDTDGTWELRDNGKLLYLYNNFRDDEEFHHLLLDDQMMKWYLFEGKSTFYQYLEKK